MYCAIKNRSVSVAIIAGIGFDTAEYLSQSGDSSSLDSAAFSREWGIDQHLVHRGGLSPTGAKVHPSPRQIFLLQRKTNKVGEGLGKAYGLDHRTSLAMHWGENA